MKHESCPELYTCSRVKMTPLIRVLLHCTAAEAMESICATCEQMRSEGEDKHNYVSPSGEEFKVVVDEGGVQVERTMVGAHTYD